MQYFVSIEAINIKIKRKNGLKYYTLCNENRIYENQSLITLQKRSFFFFFLQYSWCIYYVFSATRATKVVGTISDFKTWIQQSLKYWYSNDTNKMNHQQKRTENLTDTETGPTFLFITPIIWFELGFHNINGDAQTRFVDIFHRSHFSRK